MGATLVALFFAFLTINFWTSCFRSQLTDLWINRNFVGGMRPLARKLSKPYL
jgi:hypothetical protein